MRALRKRLVRWTRESRGYGSLAKWYSTGLLLRRFWVQVPGDPLHAPLAQWKEHLASNQGVGGSNPSRGAMKIGPFKIERHKRGFVIRRDRVEFQEPIYHFALAL